MNWASISTSAQLDVLKSKSFTDLVIIFKHSTRCSISKLVLSKFEGQLHFDNGCAFLLDLLSYRSLSNQISEDYGVKHESPQLLLIKNGECIAHASHYEINQVNPNNYINV